MVKAARVEVYLYEITFLDAAECDSLVDTWLQNSALSGHVKYLDYLKNFISRKFGSKENLHSIITATQHDKVEYLTRLLDSGIDPNTCTKDKATALHYAARLVGEQYLIEDTSLSWLCLFPENVQRRIFPNKLKKM